MSSRISFEPSEEVRHGSGYLNRTSSLSSTLCGELHKVNSSWLEEHPCALANFDQLEDAMAGKLVAVFLDYDGTLTPIVNNPDEALMSEEMREIVCHLAGLFPTAIISGRSRQKVEQFVKLRQLYYAGSHGMDIAGPRVEGPVAVECSPTFQPFQPAAEYEPLMHKVQKELWATVQNIPGATIEDNKFCVSVHFRNCAADSYSVVVNAVESVTGQYDTLHVTRGRKVLEVRPKIEWNKGYALLHLLEMLGINESEVFCLYIGDDRTDEDAFQVLRDRGLGAGVLVSSREKKTAGRWTVRDPSEVAGLLSNLVRWGKTDANMWHTRGHCNGWRVVTDRESFGTGSAGERMQCNGSATSGQTAEPSK